MSTSPYFSHAAAGGAGAPPPAGAVAAAAAQFKVPKLNVALYHRTVFTMQLSGKRKDAKISIYFDKATLQQPYISNWQAMAVLCDEDDLVVQNALGTYLGRNELLKMVNNILKAVI